MTIEALAKQFRLKITRDGYDKIILGERGYLYIDAGEVCALWTNTPITAEELKDLGAKVWVGDASPDAKKRRRDAKVTGIQEVNYAREVRLIGTHVPTKSAKFADLKKGKP